MNFISSFKRLHKWFALLVAIQLILWIISGIAFSFIDSDKKSGRLLINKTTPMVEKNEFNRFSEILKLYPSAIKIKYKRILDESVYMVTTTTTKFLLSASDLKIKKVDKRLVERLANHFYAAEGRVDKIELIIESTDDAREFSPPIWKVVYSDEESSHLYFSADTAEFQAIRTDTWRLFDFFMMLHFMDYWDRGNFNTWLIILFAVLLLLLTSSGVMLIFSSFARQDFSYLINRFRGTKKISVKILEQGDIDAQLRRVYLDKGERLMEALSDNGIDLESVCGGGGICGCCRVKILNYSVELATGNHDEHESLTDAELDEGFRLACQLSVEEELEIEIP